MPTCWANILGNCCGPQSSEHYVSKSLLTGKTITMQGQGFHWCQEHPITIPVSTACANILCKRHNENLSLLDSEISKLKDALVSYATNEDLSRGIKCWRGTTIHHLDGNKVFRWLTKTYCNLRTIGTSPPREEFVRHAFGLPHNPQIRIYLTATKDLKLELELDHLGYRSFSSDGIEQGCTIDFYGFEFLVANFEVTASNCQSLAATIGGIPISSHPLENPGFIDLHKNVGGNNELTDRIIFDHRKTSKRGKRKKKRK